MPALPGAILYQQMELMAARLLPHRTVKSGKQCMGCEAQTPDKGSVMSTQGPGRVGVGSSSAAAALIRTGETQPSLLSRTRRLGREPDPSGINPLICVKLQIVLSAKGIMEGGLRT